MRTTVTLDADVERLLKEASHRTRQSFKQVLNAAVRQSLGAAAEVPGERFQLRPRAMGLRVGLDPASLGKLADEMEMDAFLELSARLAREEQ